jgi:hypothetical protein
MICPRESRARGHVRSPGRLYLPRLALSGAEDLARDVMCVSAPVVTVRTCPACGKVSYLTRAAALWTARQRGPHARLRVYRCPVAAAWHLTSSRPRRRKRCHRGGSQRSQPCGRPAALRWSPRGRR